MVGSLHSSFWVYFFIWAVGVDSAKPLIRADSQRHIPRLHAIGLAAQHNSSQSAGALPADSKTLIGLAAQHNSSQSAGALPADSKTVPMKDGHQAEQIMLLALVLFGGVLLIILVLFHSEPKPSWEKNIKPMQEDDSVKMVLSDERRDPVDVVVYYLMSSSWPVVGLIMFEIYVVVAASFAALLMLQPGCLTGALPLTFMDAFNFSVQTLASIGYGHLSPVTDYAHAVVIVESYVGLAMHCIGGGILFSRVNRPTSRLVFSDVVVVSQNGQGQTEISMRMLNHRPSSSWVDVHARMSVVTDQVNTVFLTQLKLRREWNPVLRGTWTLTHTIGDSSPLAGLVAADQVSEGVIGMVTFVKGIEATYDKPVHAYKVYYATQFRFGQRFSDLLKETDGGFVVDSKLLSSTEPVGSSCSKKRNSLTVA
eukprot:TRINITY_DN11227_c0_g1_i5.p1 TRINITY_DN11227_c0_g1~~TRINITY_DN11227_c0_g1_i5.p1  ORF type:complete len:423 (+),score=43.39 TRINITY_DN11227_c0_g1_i5:75-1343(+)